MAQADASVAPTGGEGYIAATQPEPQADLVSITAGPTIQQITPEPEILIANPGTPTTARDPVNITGISQMVVDAGGGSVGLCTGTLINPRTVIFAAHCVNTRAATAYGANSGGTAIGFGFETNTRANAPGQTDELVRWLLGGAGGAGRFQTNTAQAFYNANWVNYNPLSLEAASRGFLYGDVAMAALDTPAANIPTWALLFSPLTNTGTIGASGTGYDVGIVGYGQNGTGQTGAAGSDFRRRSAENILGALTDLQTFEGFLFGGAPNGLTQNLYFMDFDDPRRGMTGASPFDFNAFRDNARTNPNGASLEGITSQGDSGGPLILQNAFARQVVIGVLSGGYTRFFNGQPANSYGTVSFYQPLYLYWDWIAANNPYHYVSAKAGNGSWTDPNHWVSTIDPSYMIESGGQLVNGIPTLTGEQKTGTTGDFGQICFQSGGVSDCLDTRTGVEVVENRPIGTSDDNAGSASIAEIAAGATATREALDPRRAARSAGGGCPAAGRDARQRPAGSDELRAEQRRSGPHRGYRTALFRRDAQRDRAHHAVGRQCHDRPADDRHRGRRASDRCGRFAVVADQRQPARRHGHGQRHAQLGRRLQPVRRRPDGFGADQRAVPDQRARPDRAGYPDDDRDADSRRQSGAVVGQQPVHQLRPQWHVGRAGGGGKRHLDGVGDAGRRGQLLAGGGLSGDGG